MKKRRICNNVKDQNFVKYSIRKGITGFIMWHGKRLEASIKQYQILVFLRENIIEKISKHFFLYTERRWERKIREGIKWSRDQVARLRLEGKIKWHWGYFFDFLNEFKLKRFCLKSYFEYYLFFRRYIFARNGLVKWLNKRVNKISINRIRFDCRNDWAPQKKNMLIFQMILFGSLTFLSQLFGFKLCDELKGSFF